jgi:hypothetical protein
MIEKALGNEKLQRAIITGILITLFLSIGIILGFFGYAWVQKEKIKEWDSDELTYSGKLGYLSLNFSGIDFFGEGENLTIQLDNLIELTENQSYSLLLRDWDSHVSLISSITKNVLMKNESMEIIWQIEIKNAGAHEIWLARIEGFESWGYRIDIIDLLLLNLYYYPKLSLTRFL